MNGAALALIAVALLTVVGLLAVHLLNKATMLELTAKALQDQLTQLKEGGFDRIIGEKLSRLTAHAQSEVEQRGRMIVATEQELLKQQREATNAVASLNKTFGEVTSQIASLSELQTQVGELNNLLKPQQLRGELGEVIVRSLISDKLPRGQYEEEFTFADGKKVEFVIKLQERLIPVDSKLQLEHYRRMREADERQRPALRTEFKRAIKQKIDEVKAYIKPEEGTYNFAMMVIPSEAVYYDLIGNKDFTEDGGLYEYAQQQNVFIVSPLTFWAYLTSIAHGLQGLEVGRRAEEILANLQTITRKIRDFSNEEFRVLGAHLRNASSQYDDAQRKLRDIQDRTEKLERSETHPPLEQGAIHA